MKVYLELYDDLILSTLIFSYCTVWDVRKIFFCSICQLSPSFLSIPKCMCGHVCMYAWEWMDVNMCWPSVGYQSVFYNSHNIIMNINVLMYQGMACHLCEIRNIIYSYLFLVWSLSFVLRRRCDSPYSIENDSSDNFMNVGFSESWEISNFLFSFLCSKKLWIMHRKFFSKKKSLAKDRMNTNLQITFYDTFDTQCHPFLLIKVMNLKRQK